MHSKGSRTAMNVRELVARSRAKQNLPPRIEDPATLARIAALSER